MIIIIKINSKIIIKINNLYDQLKKNKQLELAKDKKYRQWSHDIAYSMLKLDYRERVLYYLYRGVPPYERHTIEELSLVLEISPVVIVRMIKQIFKKTSK